MRACRRTAPWVLAIVVASACSSSDTTLPSVAPPTESTAPATVTSPTAPITAPPTTAPRSTDAATTAPPTSAPPVTVAPPPTASTAPPVTAPPPPLAGFVLRDDGIGAVRFGDDPDEVIGYVSSLLGSPTADTGWSAAAEVGLCPGTEFRQTEWGVLRLGFGDESPFAVGEGHFAGWEYGIEGRLGEEPQGLITALGVGLGARVDELRDAYPGVEVFDGEEGLFPPAFFVNEFFDGFLTGTTAVDRVTVMFGGIRCGG